MIKLPVACPTKRIAGTMKVMYPWNRRLSYFGLKVPQRILDRRHPSSIILEKRHVSTADSTEQVATLRKSSRVRTIIQGFTKEERLEACLLLVDNEHIMAPERLSEEDLEARLKKMFQNADTDGDGDLTREEFESWFRRGLDSSTQRFTFDESSTITAAEEESQDKMQPPTEAELRAYSLRVALPFFGFGFIDNSLMIMSGDLIDLTLSQKFGVSMLFSAGLGNVFADSLGVYTSDMIEKMSGKISPKSGKLTANQRRMKCTRRRKTIFRIVGISTGCLAGMFPLLFL